MTATIHRIILFLLPCTCVVIAAEKNDEELMKRNAAEQAAALNQDPGGGDRNRLLHQRSMAKILAGVPGERNPHPDAQWFGNTSLGLFLHWSISSVHGGIDLSWPMIRNMGPNQKIKPADYWKLADQFKAENYDPNLWLKTAKEAGFEYAVLTAKHHDGFTLWPTKTSEIGVHISLPGRDLIKDYIAACHANGLKVGLYYSGPDWYKSKDYMSFNYRSESGGNSSLPPVPGRPDLDMNWEPRKLQPMPSDVRKRIQQECREQLIELLTKYGKIDLLWFDGGTGSNITYEEIRRLQPAIVINNRGGMLRRQGGPKHHGDFFTVEHGDQPFRPPGWWEQLRIWNSPTWGYMKHNEKSYTKTASILKSLARTKAWGGAVMANVGPRPDGTMPPPYDQGMAEVRDWMKANREAIIGAQAMPEEMQANVPVTTRDNTWYLHAIAGSKGKLTVKPGKQNATIRSAKVLRTGKAVPFSWNRDQWEIPFPEASPHQPHEVIVVTLQASNNTKDQNR
jgi:alpha-L-fucosidase